MTQEEKFIIETSRSSFTEMLSQAEGLKRQIVIEAQGSLGYQFAERMAMEARAALKSLELQEQELIRQ